MQIPRLLLTAALAVTVCTTNAADTKAQVAASDLEPKMACWGCDRFWKPCCGFPKPPEDKGAEDTPGLRGAAPQDEAARWCGADCTTEWAPCCAANNT
uniref:Secreted protein n=1 Tax=Achlya hypogyna TaxID=1202772 RepID=A0A0A7CMG9_ACHHY|nr:secreted protein [Achlya hypogyna]